MNTELVSSLVRLRYYINLAIQCDNHFLLMPALLCVISFLCKDYKVLNHYKYGK